VSGWYDNEWGYASRCVDLLQFVGKQLYDDEQADGTRPCRGAAPRQAGTRARGLQRPARCRPPGHRRHAHPRRDPHDRAPARSRAPASCCLSHLGRPKGKPESKYSLQPVAKRLAELLAGPQVSFVESTDSDEALKATTELKPGEVVLLENTRFLGGEETNDERLSRALAELATCT
jgi:hypothetical protein